MKSLSEIDVMENYKKMVEAAFKEKADFYIFNSTKEHAEIILKNIIESAETEILFFTGCDESFFSKDNGIVAALVKKSKKVKVKLIQDGDTTEGFHKELQAAGNNLQLYRLENKFDSVDLGTLIPRTGYDKVKHFMVADGHAFRAEIPHKPGESIVQAIASPNNPNVAKPLAKLFDFLITEQHAIPLPA